MFQSDVGEKHLPKIQLIVLDTKRVKMKFSHARDQKGEAQPLPKKQKVGKVARPLQEGEVDYSVELDFNPLAKTVRGFEADQQNRERQSTSEKTSKEENFKATYSKENSQHKRASHEEKRDSKVTKKDKKDKKRGKGEKKREKRE